MQLSNTLYTWLIFRHKPEHHECDTTKIMVQIIMNNIEEWWDRLFLMEETVKFSKIISKKSFPKPKWWCEVHLVWLLRSAFPKCGSILGVIFDSIIWNLRGDCLHRTFFNHHSLMRSSNTRTHHPSPIYDVSGIFVARAK